MHWQSIKWTTITMTTSLAVIQTEHRQCVNETERGTKGMRAEKKKTSAAWEENLAEQMFYSHLCDSQLVLAQLCPTSYCFVSHFRFWEADTVSTSLCNWPLHP